MIIRYSDALLRDATETVDSAVKNQAEVNVALIAEQIQARNPLDNVALEDIETLVLKTAERHHVAMTFSGTMERRYSGLNGTKPSMNGSSATG